MNRENCQRALEKLVIETGDWIKQERTKFNQNQIEKKGRNDLVSYVDRTAEAQLTEALKSLIPGAGFLNEEGGAAEGNEYTWIIDPLDGTTNFIHGIPIYGVSVALALNQQVIIGCVYDPERNELFSAGLGTGAFRNGQPIHVSQTPTLSESLVATGFPYTWFDHMDAYLNAFKEMLQKTQGLRRPGAASIDLVWTACGRFDAYFESWLKPWDIAAGMLIVTEAGGKVSTFSGSDSVLYANEILATNAFIHAEMAEILMKYPVQ
jgi:myo-inositol-1(or 4)-monophosphatase